MTGKVRSVTVGRVGSAVDAWLREWEVSASPLTALALEVASTLDRTSAARDTAALSAELRKVLAEIREREALIDAAGDELAILLSTPTPGWGTQ